MFSKSWQPKGLTNQYVFTMLQLTAAQNDKHGYYITKQGFLQDSQ